MEIERDPSVGTATVNPMSSFSVEPANETTHYGNRTSSISVLGTEVKTLCFCIPLSWIMKPEEGDHVQLKNSDISTVFLLLNYMIGSGIVVQAYVFSQSGIIVCVFEYIVIGIMNYVGVNLLVQCAEETRVFDYSHLAEKILGTKGSLLVDISIIIGAAGSLLSYILIIGTVLTEVVEHCSGWYCNIVFLTIVPVSLFTVPLCLLRNFGHLAVASYISITVISASVLLVIIGGPVENAHSAVTHYKLGSFLGSIRTVGDIVFALGYITATFHSYNAMENRSIANFNRVTLSTTILGAIMCFATGLAGYLSFGDNTDTNIIENFNGAVGGVFKVALVIHLVLYIPGDFVIMRAALLKMRGIDIHKQSDFAFVTFSLSCIGFITFIALLLQVFLSSTDSLAIVVDITGGVAGSILYFVVPGLCAMQLFKNDRETYLKSVTLLLFGMAIVVLVIISSAM